MPGKEYTDLKAGLLAHHIPSGSWAFVVKLVAGIDFAGFFDGGDHIIVRRTSGKSPLYVYYGYTNGVISEKRDSRHGRGSDSLSFRPRYRQLGC